MKIEVFPKVFKVGANRKISVKARGAKEVKIRISGMESYTIPHEKYRIDEAERYPLIQAEKNGDVFTAVCDFPVEQKYRVSVFLDGEKFFTYVYALEEDLYSLKVFKGDTHIHTNNSDGDSPPSAVGLNFRAKGYDFITITDHHKFYPSVETNAIFSPLTSAFKVFLGEEVHNRDMGYFHVVNFGGEKSVNELVEKSPEYVKSEVEKIESELKVPSGVSKTAVAYRIFFAREIKKAGGVAIFSHPFWEVYGEYNAQVEDIKFLLKGGYFDAVEVFADHDHVHNGNNLASALYYELLGDGVKTGIVGASDTHRFKISTLFGKVFTIAFAKDFDDVKGAIKSGRTVAVDYRSKRDFWAVGSFRLVKYARFLISEYFPKHEKLCKKHSLALSKKDMPAIKKAEEEINEYRAKFFN